MKTICLAVILIATGIGAASQAAHPEMPRNVTEVFDRSVSGAERALLSVADAMPEDKYDFVPVNGEFKGVRTFGQMVKHVAIDNYVAGAALLRERIPIDPGVHENGPDSIRGKAELLRLLQNSFAYMHKAIGTVNKNNLMQLLSFQESGDIPRLSIVSSAISHPWDHYGQLVEYLRVNGIDPQAKH
jgi:hypothetical protein